MTVSITKISRNGQVVIPKEIRKLAGIKPRTKFLIMKEGEHIVLKPVPGEVLKELRGGKGVPDTKLSEKELEGLLLEYSRKLI